jgi:hypothetical protein
MGQEVSSSGEILTNDKVMTMAKAGLPTSVIVNKIRASKTNFNIDTDELIRLQQASLHTDIINAMVEASNPARTTSPQPDSRRGESGASGAYPNEIGVYLKKDGRWEEVLPEVVNWKTGGVMKSVASFGVIKGDVNGHLEGKQSNVQIGSQSEFVIIVPEGIAITEYQLLKLNQHSDNREFRTITGGIFHAKGGATRDLLSFEGRKIASRTFSITLNGLKAGEYGFLPPGWLTSASGASPLGKMYTFGVTAQQ